MPIKLDQEPCLSEGGVDVIAIDFTDWLDSGELLTGTPTVEELDAEDGDPVTGTAGDLTFANIAVSTAELTILGDTVAIGAAVQYKVSGQQSGTRYWIRVTTSTDATPARTQVVEHSLDGV